MSRPATYKQKMALYLATDKKLELRNMDLSCEDAKILIQKTHNGENVVPLLLDMGATEKGEYVPRERKSSVGATFTAEEVNLIRNMSDILSVGFDSDLLLVLESLKNKIEMNCSEEVEAAF